MDLLPEAQSTARTRLIDWIKAKYAGRDIRIGGGPYFNHLIEVAEMAARSVLLGYEVGLCHDLLEIAGFNMRLADAVDKKRIILTGMMSATPAFIRPRHFVLTNSYHLQSAGGYPKAVDEIFGFLDRG